MDFSNKADIKALDADVRVALEEVAAKHGITVKAGGGTYDPSAATFKPRVEFSATDSDKRTFVQWAEVYGLQPSDFGKTFTTPDGKSYTIAGVNTRASKRPIMARSTDDGKNYGFTAEYVASRVVVGGA